MRDAVHSLDGNESVGQICEFGCKTNDIAGVIRLLDQIDARKYDEATLLVRLEDKTLAAIFASQSPLAIDHTRRLRSGGPLLAIEI